MEALAGVRLAGALVEALAVIRLAGARALVEVLALVEALAVIRLAGARALVEALAHSLACVSQDHFVFNETIGFSTFHRSFLVPTIVAMMISFFQGVVSGEPSFASFLFRCDAFRASHSVCVDGDEAGALIIAVNNVALPPGCPMSCQDSVCLGDDRATTRLVLGRTPFMCSTSWYERPNDAMPESTSRTMPLGQVRAFDLVLV